MNLEKRVIQVCQACAMKHMRDINKAVDEAKQKLKLPPLPKWVAVLVENALREQIHFARHISNKKLRKAAGEYGGPGKVGSSSALDELADAIWQESVFNHTICGWLLGDIEKEELLYFAEVEEEKAAGSMFNAELCRWVYKLIAKRQGATVRECMREDELLKIFRKLRKGRDAA